MTTERELVERAVDLDLFGEHGLKAPPPPEFSEKYAVEKTLGQGGFGTVFLARDLQLDRPVALKVLSHARPIEVERLRREARFTARLDDPAIVKVYELGETEGQPYIAMQYIDGHHLGEAQLEMRDLVGAMRDLALALHKAHAIGVVHRDIKPENILIDGEGRPHLTDFGIARDLRARPGATLSHEGQLIGTPYLMPPEQAKGNIHAIDARSDIYSLGATLYVSLTGRRPFDAENLIDLLHAVLHDEPTWPRAFVPDIPRSLESLILRCLHKDQAQRFQSMIELASSFDQILAGHSVEGESKAWFANLVRSVVGGAPKKVERPVEADPLASVGMEIAADLAAWDGNRYRVSRNISKTFLQLDKVLERLDGILKKRPDVAWARFYRGAALLRRGRLDEALDEMERSIDRVSHLATSNFELGRLYLQLFLKQYRTARKHIDERGVDGALTSARGRLEQAMISFHEAARVETDLSKWQIRYAEAIRSLSVSDYESCVTACDEILEEDPDAEEVWKLRGDALQFAEASGPPMKEDPLESYDQALLIRRSYYEVWHEKAMVHSRRGDFGAARDCLKRALDIYPEFADAHTEIARVSLAEAAKDKSASLDRAIEALDQAKRFAPDDYDATVTKIEVLLEGSRIQDSPFDMNGVLTSLEEARSLLGCRNRVDLLEVDVRREGIRRIELRGGDSGPAIQALRHYVHSKPEAMIAYEPWLSIVREVDAMKPGSSGGASG